LPAHSTIAWHWSRQSPAPAAARPHTDSAAAERGGKEGLSEMMRKYPNWFSPHLHEFWGQPDKLPFDEHWFIALAAPRPFIALEGTHDQNVNANGVRQAWLAAQPAFVLLNVKEKLGVSWA
jgi:hypothetical protein